MSRKTENNAKIQHFTPLFNTCKKDNIFKAKLERERFMITALLIILSIIGACSQSVFKKAFALKHDAPFIFSVISVISTALFFTVSTGGNFIFTWDYVPYSIGFGACYASSFLCFMYAIKYGSLALTSLALSYSLVIPTLFGILFLGEDLTALSVVGIILLLISLYLINYEKDEKKITVKWIIYTLVTALGNGGCMVFMKLQQINQNFQYRNEFMVTGLLIVIITSFIFAIINNRDKIKLCIKPVILLPVACGFANALGNYCSLKLSPLPVSFVSPICSAGGILGTAAISLFIYKEKFNFKQVFGIVLGTLSVIALSMKDIKIEDYIIKWLEI